MKLPEQGIERFWECTYCGTRLPGPSIDLAEANCKCGRGRGRWFVRTIPLMITDSENAKELS